MIATSPAPWVIGSNGASVKVVDSEGKAVCMLTPRRDQFNGDLIAAAPDLLNALDGLLDYLRDYDADYPEAAPIFGKARAAIAKATGENT
jgi:hypothetical protein